MKTTINSLSEFINVICKDRQRPERLNFFRGQGEFIAAPKPKILRDRRLQRFESSCLKELQRRAPEEFRKDSLAFDQLVRAQHYGIPTRLLDITMNPLTAVFFAVSNASGKDGHVIWYQHSRSNIYFYNSATASILSNLSLIGPESKIQLIKDIKRSLSIVSLETGKDVQNLHESLKDQDFHTMLKRHANENSEILRTLRNRTVTEVGLVREEISPSNLFTKPFVLPRETNNRLKAQSGCFILFGLEDDSLFKSATPHYQDIIIPAEKKEEIIHQLKMVGISKENIFPEMENIAKSIMESIDLPS